MGSDFLAEFYLAPNHRDGTLLDLKDFSTIAVGIDNVSQPIRVNFIDQATDPCYKLLDDFPTLTNPSFELKEPLHGVKHHIPTTGRPIQSRARKLAPEKLAMAKTELERLVKMGVCHRGKSEWSSPMHVVGKPDGGQRVCGDYRRLNTVTIDDKYPVKNIADFNADLSGMKVFSKIDLLKGYYQIPVAEDDIGKTGMITPFGLFVFPRTPFGLKNAGQDFQRLMDEILGDIPHVFVYIDDILVASENMEQHLQDLKMVFKILSDNGLVINRKKCVLGKSSLEFLGYYVDKDGVKPLDERVDAIRQTTRPTTVKELQRFLGMINYYRRFIKNAAGHLYHLFSALEGKPKVLKWTPEMQGSFEAIKEALASATLLHHPRHDAQLALTADASKVAMGAVLEQRGPKGWEPLAYFSKKLSTPQGEWPPFDRELLAAFRAIRHFRHMVEGRQFTLYTDHNSLVPALRKKAEPHTARQTYQLSAISEYTTDLRYIEGKANVVADALSRPNASPIPVTPSGSTSLVNNDTSGFDSRGATAQNRNSNTGWAPTGQAAASFPSLSAIRQATAEPRRHDYANAVGNNSPPSEVKPQAAEPRPIASPRQTNSTPTPISAVDKPLDSVKDSDFRTVIASVGQLGVDLAEMARDQPLDADFNQLSNDARSGLNFRKIDVGNSTLLVDVSNGPARAWVPANWRKRIFDAVHGLGHPGVNRTQQTVAAKFVWPSMRADVGQWARQCVPCQRAKVTRNITPPIGEFEVPSKRFSHIHADIVMMPDSNGFSYLLTVVDRFTRWPTAIPLQNIRAETVIDALAHGWIAQFGIPAAITTDRGTQFTSGIWSQLLRSWGIRHNLTTAYHPESNGLVERLHRRLKEALKALSSDAPDKWFWKLPCALLAVRTTVKPDIGASPADLVFGEGLAVPGDLLGSIPNDNEMQRQRQNLLAGMRFEVSRLQPTPTSAHRQPQVYVPDSLDGATHVFIRRGGVQPPLTAPYDGPFRVEERTPHGFRVHLPGRGVETVALARVKPALISNENHAQRDNDASPTPPSQPRQEEEQTEPNDPSRPSTSSEAPRTSQQHNPSSTLPPRSLARPSPQPSAQTAGQSRRQRVPNIDEFVAPPPRVPPPAQPRSFDDWLAVDNAASLPVQQRPAQSGQPSSRRRPDVSALAAIIRNHLDPAAEISKTEDSSTPQDASISLGGV